MAAPTDFLTVNQVPVEVERGTFRQVPNRIRRKRRLQSSKLSVNRKAKKLTWAGMTPMLTGANGLWVEDILDGVGEVVDFTSAYSRHGYGPTAGSDYSVAGGICTLDDGADGYTLDLPNFYDDAWTIIARVSHYEGSGASRVHVGLNSDSEQSAAGSTSAVTMTDYISQATGGLFTLEAFTGAARTVSYLAVLPYVLPQEQLNAWTSASVDPPPMPFVRLGGTCLRNRYGEDEEDGTTVLFESDAEEYEDANFGDGNGTVHAVKIDFTVEEQ